MGAREDYEDADMTILLHALEERTTHYWTANERLRRLAVAIHNRIVRNGHSTGDPMVDYCITRHGFLWLDMVERYKKLHALLHGRTGQLAALCWNETVSYGNGLCFYVGILSDETIKFERSFGCIFPFSAHLSSSHPVNTPTQTREIREGLTQLWVPAADNHEELHRSWAELSLKFLQSTSNMPQLVEVIVGDEPVGQFFDSLRGAWLPWKDVAALRARLLAAATPA